MTATGLVCSSCGIELPQNAKFCLECGAAVAAATPAEYKQVTVLFADVVHSMDIAAAVGAERLREIMASLLDCSAAVVQRYGGTVNNFTGDGIMALFGAPVALEDHALRACRAALEIHSGISDLAREVSRRDGVVLQLRIGLNSGQVITGEIGTATTGYTAIGEQVGLAQRMESVAPPGGVMLSESTARLVKGAAALDEPELVQIKGADEPVSAHRLLGVSERDRPVAGSQSALVGRQWEISAIESLLDRAIHGHGAVVGVVGSPGIGKSRLVREVSAMADRGGVEVFATFCESHTNQVPFHAVARLLRAAIGVEGLDGPTARDRVRDRVPDADPEDLLLLDDLLGIADPNVVLPKVDPDARRRRLTALVNAVSLARTEPAFFVIEDAHWIDEVSESLLAEFFTVIPQTPSLVLVTYRPEYEGALARVHGAQTIALAPLSDSETTALVSGLLGPDPSVGALVQKVAQRAAGNPFFAEEIVRELAERSVLEGERGAYICGADAADVSVPATLQAAIGARIDRLEAAAKQTLNAAAVVGLRFTAELLAALGTDPVLDPLVRAELVDQVRFTPSAEYAFHHPLIRAVAYESQLKSDRAQLHRRLAANIEQHDQNAAIIAEHLEAAGDLREAYEWHMRAGTSSSLRDIAAARASWRRAQQVADALPVDDPDRLTMRIAPRTNLCATTFRWAASFEDSGFAELRELCAAAGDKRSLAIAMLGQMTELMVKARQCEAAQLAFEQEGLLASIGDPDLTLGLLWGSLAVMQETGRMADLLRWAQLGIDIADGDPLKGNFISGSPLALALVFRGYARALLGLPGWREDFHDGVAMAHDHDLLTFASAVVYKYAPVLQQGVLVLDNVAFGEMEEAFQVALEFGDHNAVGLTKYGLGAALLEARADVERGLQMLTEIREMIDRGQFFSSELPALDLLEAREDALNGDFDAALPLMRAAVDTLFDNGQFTVISWATSVLVISLLDRGTEDAMVEAETAIERLAAAPIDDLIVRDITELRLRALLAQARGHQSTYRDYRDRYRAMATELGFEGQMKWAEAMP